MTRVERQYKWVFSWPVWLVVLFGLMLYRPAGAAVLKPETLAAWESYVKIVSAQNMDRPVPGHPFLKIAGTGAQAEKVRGGEPLVMPVGQNPHKVPGGLIHHWLGTAFIPSADIDAVLSTVRDYGHYKEFYAPAVIAAKPLKCEAQIDRFSMVLTSKTLVSRTALDGDYESSLVKVDDRRWFSLSRTIRIQEVENYGTPNQHALDENEGSGLIWRLLSVTRFEQRDGGVYVEMEAIALSREIPSSLRWVVAPLVRRVSKNSLLTSLQQTSDAVISREPVVAHLASGHREAPVPHNPAVGGSFSLVR